MAQKNKSSGHGRRGNKRRTVAIFPEGAKAEANYFDMVKTMFHTLPVESLRSRDKNASQQILKRVWTDQIWIVIDKNNWSSHMLDELVNLFKKYFRHRFDYSNQNLEYWLLLSDRKLSQLSKHLLSKSTREVLISQRMNSISERKSICLPCWRSGNC